MEYVHTGTDIDRLLIDFNEGRGFLKVIIFRASDQQYEKQV